MNRKNKLRKIYMAYWTILGVLYCVAFILSASYIEQDPLRSVVRIIGWAGILVFPLVMVFFYRWLRKDNAEASDELEQMVLTRAFAVTGLVSLSLLPFLLLLCALFTESAGYFAFGFTFIIGATFKLGTVYIHKKY